MVSEPAHRTQPLIPIQSEVVDPPVNATMSAIGPIVPATAQIT